MYNGGSLRAREYGSLTGSYTPQQHPIDVKTTVAADDYAVTIAEAKRFVGVYDNASDSIFQILVGACQEQVERYLQIDMVVRTRQAYWQRPANNIILPYGIHGAVGSVVSRTTQGVDTTLVSGTDYYVQGIDYKNIEFVNFANNGRFIIVNFQSGYAFDNVPQVFKAAILQEVSLQFKHRQDNNQSSRIVVDGVSVETQTLLRGYKRRVI